MKSTGRDNSRFELIVLFVAALIVFTAALGRRDIVTSHEARVAQTARIMADSGWPTAAQPVRVSGFVESNETNAIAPQSLLGGRDQANPWVFPVINGQIRMQKPPLPYWITAIVFRIFGASELNARLVPALLGALATLLIWDLARLILGRRAALAAALVWISSRFIVDEYRKSMADPYLAFFVLLAIWAWWRCGRGRNILAYVALALGVLAKGPVIFVFVVPAMVLAKLLLRRRGGSPPWKAHALGALLFLAIVLPWPLTVLHHAPQIWRIWWYESGGEISGENIEKARPFWLYFASMFQLALPWTPVWIAGIVLTIDRLRRRGLTPRNRRRLFALAWYAVMLIFFSCLHVKKDAYLLPVMPAQALIVAEALVMIRVSLARKLRGDEMSGVLVAMQYAIAIGFGCGIAFVARNKSIGVIGLTICAIALLLALLTIPPIARKRWRPWSIAQSTAYALLLIVLIGFYEAAIDNRRSPRAFGAALTEHLKTTEVPLLVRRLPEEASFYLPLNLPDAGEAQRMLIVIDHSPKDPPVSGERLSNLLNGATIRGYKRVYLQANDSVDRWQLFDVVIDRNRA